MTTAIEFPSSGVATFVADLAHRYGVTYAKSGNDALAELITQFSGDSVLTDETEDLIVALKRSSVIDGSQMVTLLGNYLDEAKHVRSVR